MDYIKSSGPVTSVLAIAGAYLIATTTFSFFRALASLFLIPGASVSFQFTLTDLY